MFFFFTVLTSDELAIQNWKLCPRSDSTPQWRVSFEVNSAIVFGIFCNNMALNRANICVNYRGALVIKREQFENQTGTYNFKSSELNSSLQIMFSKSTY